MLFKNRNDKISFEDGGITAIEKLENNGFEIPTIFFYGVTIELKAGSITNYYERVKRVKMIEFSVGTKIVAPP